MNEPISFSGALSMSGNMTKKYLLLGNGFSSALYPDIFRYSSLLAEADFQDKPHLKSVFEKLKTQDFEHVIRSLEIASEFLKCYSVDESLTGRLKEDANAVRKVLVETISKKHPHKVTALDENAIKSCNLFLNNFSKIYSLNYDILLYWVLLSGRDGRDEDIDDGFRLPDGEFGADYRTFDSPHSPTFFYLHGGLHLFDSGPDTRKYVWCDTGMAIMDQVDQALQKGLYPLFVAEGESWQKQTKINHNAYLAKGLRSFEAICDQKKADLFIFGHSLDANDAHILSLLKKGKIGRVFVSVYKGEDGYDEDLIYRAEGLGVLRKEKYPLEVILFDAGSANVWGAI